MTILVIMIDSVKQNSRIILIRTYFIIFRYTEYKRFANSATPLVPLSRELDIKYIFQLL